MNIFTEHTQQQGVTYMEHMFFAIGIAIRLANSVIAFILHGIFPFIDIKRELDLEATARSSTQKTTGLSVKNKSSKWNRSITLFFKPDKLMLYKNIFDSFIQIVIPANTYMDKVRSCNNREGDLGHGRGRQRPEQVVENNAGAVAEYAEAKAGIKHADRHTGESLYPVCYATAPFHLKQGLK